MISCVTTIVFVTLHVRQSAQAVPLAAATIAASLSPLQRSSIRLIDAYLADSDDDIVAQIFSVDPYLISFSLYVWNKQRVMGLAQKIRQRDPNIVLIVGGPEATACYQELCDMALFDHVIAGEGEGVLPVLVNAVAEQRSFILPPMVEDPIDLAGQVSPWLSGVLVPGQGVLWETSRGCPFQCAFCYDARGSRGVREITFKRLEQELQLFVAHGVSQVWVLDSTFNYPPERGKQLLKLIAEHAPQLHFHLEAKAEFLDEETVFLLQQLCCSVQVGLQSVRSSVLKNINRSFDLECFADRVQMLSDAGITFGIDLIYALPGDDAAGLRESLNYALQFCPNHVEVFPLALLPGTKLFQQRSRYGLEALAQPPYTVTSSDSMSEGQLKQCRKLAAATDIFYNTGRSMAYFLPLCHACCLDAVEIIERFADWLIDELNCDDQQISEMNCTPMQAYSFQQAFITDLFQRQKVDNLLPLALDLIRFHTCWADTLLGAETLPRTDLRMEDGEEGENDAWLNRPWRLASSVRVEMFHYDVEELSMAQDIDLVEFVELSPPCASTGLFIRRADEVFCESIDEIFAALLMQSCGKQTPAQILAPFSAGLTSGDSIELVAFAVSEGLLV